MTLQNECEQTLDNEWLKVLRRLWAAYDKPIQAEQFELYVEELGNVPIGLLDPAIKAIINDGNRAPFFPRLSELKAAISHTMQLDMTDGTVTQDNNDEWCNRQDEKYIRWCTWKHTERTDRCLT